MKPKIQDKFVASVIQLCSQQNPKENLEKALFYVREAHKEGAEWVGLPENFYYLRPEGEPMEVRSSLKGEPIRTLQRLAKELGIYLLCGTVAERSRGEKVSNTSVFIDPNGNITAVYRKIHLFDIAMESGFTLKESKHVRPGRQIVLAPTRWGSIGLSVCYDLRFPELYRKMVEKGAFALATPSAFTYETGRDHWTVLLRARAIENQAFVFAPAQVGKHSARRHSFGHSCIIDPWGDLLGVLEEGEGIVTAEIDLRKQRELRRRFPVLQHRRL